MNSREYIESGILELFVFGKLTDAENNEVLEMAKNNPEIQQDSDDSGNDGSTRIILK